MIELNKRIVYVVFIENTQSLFYKSCPFFIELLNIFSIRQVVVALPAKDIIHFFLNNLSKLTKNN